MASLTIENYVKAIYQIAAASEGRLTATGQIADALGVLPGTVTSMLKTLSEANLVTYMPYEGVQLTQSGSTLALRVLRRHRLIELFLVKTLDLSWDEVHEEAEHMEHAVSDHLIDRIDTYLDYPDADPHGDPIPRADGSMQSSSGRSLSICNQGERFRLVRVLDQSPDFLRYLSQSGLELGAEGELVDSQTEAGVITVQIVGAGDSLSLALATAEKLLVV